MAPAKLDRPVDVLETAKALEIDVSQLERLVEQLQQEISTKCPKEKLIETVDMVQVALLRTVLRSCELERPVLTRLGWFVEHRNSFRVSDFLNIQSALDKWFAQNCTVRAISNGTGWVFECLEDATLFWMNFR